MGHHAVATAGRDVDADLVEAFLNASRVLVAVAARSLAAGDSDITLAQHRALVVLGSRGPQRISDLAEQLAVNSSTTTRHCDRLERRGLVRRDRSTSDRRVVVISLTDAGVDLLRRITVARRADIGGVLSAMAPRAREGLVVALRSFSEAAGEVPEQSWSHGWGL